MKAWMVRAGSDGEREQEALAQGAVYAGWRAVEDLSGAASRGDIESCVRAAYPEASTYTVGNWTGQLERFVHSIKPGDVVVMPRRGVRGYALGRISSPYIYDASAPESLRHKRSVTWKQELIDPTTLRGDLRASLGSILTVFELARNNAVGRLVAVEGGGVDPGQSTEQNLELASFDEIAQFAPVITSARTLVHLVGQLRRSAGAIDTIEQELSSRGLATRTPLTEGLIDDDVEVTSIAVLNGGPQRTIEAHDQRFSLGVIGSLRQSPSTVDLSDGIAMAKTLLIRDNIDQVLVHDQGAPVGLIGWPSISRAQGQGSVITAADALAPLPPRYSLSHPLIEILPVIESEGHVLAVDDDGSAQLVSFKEIFSYLSRDRIPLLAIEQIELSLRSATKRTFTDADVKSSDANVDRIDDLTLGSYAYLYTSDAQWDGLPWGHLDRNLFFDEVEFARKIRNQLSHFSPDPLPPNTTLRLQGLLRLLRG